MHLVTPARKLSREVLIVSLADGVFWCEYDELAKGYLDTFSVLYVHIIRIPSLNNLKICGPKQGWKFFGVCGRATFVVIFEEQSLPGSRCDMSPITYSSSYNDCLPLTRVEMQPCRRFRCWAALY